MGAAALSAWSAGRAGEEMASNRMAAQRPRRQERLPSTKKESARPTAALRDGADLGRTPAPLGRGPVRAGTVAKPLGVAWCRPAVFPSQGTVTLGPLSSSAGPVKSMFV